MEAQSGLAGLVPIEKVSQTFFNDGVSYRNAQNFKPVL